MTRTSGATDFLFEEGLKAFSENYLTEKLGINPTQSAILIVNVYKIIRDAKKGEFKKLSDFIIKAGDTGVKTTKFIADLKSQFGIDVNMPKDNKEATKIVLNTVDPAPSK